MNIPSRVKVGGVTFDVIEKDSVVVGTDVCLGVVKFDESVIELESGQGFDRKQITFLHELTHAVLDNIAMMDLCANEEFVDRFARGWYQVIQDNPEMFGVGLFGQ